MLEHSFTGGGEGGCIFGMGHDLQAVEMWQHMTNIVFNCDQKKQRGTEVKRVGGREGGVPPPGPNLGNGVK